MSVRPTIDKVRLIMKQHPEYMVEENLDIDKLYSNSSVEFKCGVGHKFSQILTNAFNHDGTLRCPICSNHRILRGYNDMWTTAPELAAYLENPEDGYKYTKGSNQILTWKCPKCQYVYQRQPNQMSTYLNKCPACSDAVSYPEKFMAAVLRQISLPYEQQKMFDWANRKRYDFFIGEMHLIIEVNGKQHYEGMFSRNADEMYEDDREKRELALANHIKEYITLDCRHSTIEWMRDAIMSSLLPTLLFFDEEDIDWEFCHQEALNSSTHEICEAYNHGQTVKEIAIWFDCSQTTIRTHLKKGALLGLCDYDVAKVAEQTKIENGRRVLATMCKPVAQYDTNGTLIALFPSIQEAQRQTGIKDICAVLKGRRKTKGGYVWKYQ